MKAVLQRVTRASVRIDKKAIGEIDRGFVVLLGVARDDDESDADSLLDQVLGIRVFADTEDRMNLSLLETHGALLIVSQFTLFADTTKGRRPSFFHAADPEKGKKLYDIFVEKARARVPVATGEFGARMEVDLVNDGPVTIVLNTSRP